MPMDVKTLCLGVLNRGEATGYEIKKECEEGPFSHFFAAGFGSIYPALNALCANGLVSVEAQAQEKRPDKKVYNITPSGRLHLAQALTEPPGRDRFRSDFWFIVFFSHLLEPRQLDEIIQARIDNLNAELAEMDGCDMSAGPPGEMFVLGAGKAITKAEVDYLEANRHALVGGVLLRSTEKASEKEPAGDDTPAASEANASAAE